MICLRCGICCKHYAVIIVDDPEKGITKGNLILHAGMGACKHLMGDEPGKYSCNVHDELWYSETPCFSHTQIERGNTNCRMGEYILESYHNKEDQMDWLDNLLDIAQKHTLEPTKLKDGLHGREHWKRVAMMANWLSERYGGNRGAIISAAVLHDIGRINEEEDPRHGYRAVVPASAAMIREEWLLPAFQLSTLRYGQFSLSLPQIGKASCAIAHHCLGEGLQPTLEMKLVRLADQLDRYRLNDPKDWPNFMIMESGLYTHEVREKAKAFVREGKELD